MVLGTFVIFYILSHVILVFPETLTKKEPNPEIIHKKANNPKTSSNI